MKSEPIRPEALLAHAGFVSGLAESLVFGHEGADDLRQETFARALEKPPAAGPGLRSWLATVARNLLRQERRARLRRDRRERAVARPEAHAGTALERERARRRVVDAVERLAEPYRTAIVLRYLDELPPRAIAKRLGVPVETARTRIKRGLAKLREDLDRRLGGDRDAWCAALLPLIRSGRAAGGAAAGVAVMGTKLTGPVVAVVVLLLLGGGIWWIGSSPPEAAPERPEETGETETRTAEAPAPPPDEEPAAEPDGGASIAVRFAAGAGGAVPPEEVAARYRAAGIPLVAQVVDEDAITGGGPASLFRILFGPAEAWRREAPVLVDRGALRVATPPDVDRCRLFLGRPGAAPMLTGVVTGGEVVVPLPESPESHEARFTVGRTDEPLAGAVVTPVYEYGDDRAFLPGPPLRTDADGRVTLALLEDEVRGRNRQPTWWVEGKGRLRSVSAHELRSGPPGGTRTMPVLRSASVEGKAYRPDGEPAAGLEVAWTSKGRVARATVAEDGSFRLDGIEPGDGPAPRVTVALLLDPGSGRISGTEVAVRPGETARADVGRPAAGRATAIVGLAVTAGGEPVEGAYLVVECRGEAGDRRFAQTDDEGTCRLEDLPAGPARVEVYFGDPRVSDDHRATHRGDVELKAAAERTFEFELPAGAILVTLLDDGTGEPVVGGVALGGPADREAGSDRFPGFRWRPGWSGFSDERGRVLLRGLLPGKEHTLLAGGEGYAKAKVEGRIPGRADAPAEVTIRLAKE